MSTKMSMFPIVRQGILLKKKNIKKCLHIVFELYNMCTLHIIVLGQVSLRWVYLEKKNEKICTHVLRWYY